MNFVSLLVCYFHAVAAQGSISQPIISSNLQTLTVVSATSAMQGNFKAIGTADNVIIQNAINQLGAAGGKIILSEGTFTISNQLILASNLVLVGQGMQKTIIRSSDNSGPFMNAGTLRGISNEGLQISNLVLQDFTADGNKLNNPGNAYTTGTPAYGKFGFYCEACKSILVQRVAMNNFTGYGFDPHGTAGTPIPSTDVTIDSCLAADNNWDGFTIDKVTNGTVINNISKKNGRHGFNVVTGSTYVLVANNVAQDNGFAYNIDPSTQGNGITIQSNAGLTSSTVYNTSHIRIQNNTISNSAGAGVLFKMAAESVAVQNTVTGGLFCLGFVQNVNVEAHGNICGALTNKDQGNVGLVVDGAMAALVPVGSGSSVNGSGSAIPTRNGGHGAVGRAMGVVYVVALMLL